MSVAGGNSISSTISVTPGGAGVTQAVNVASLSEVTDAVDRNGLLGRPAADHDVWNTGVRRRRGVWAFGWTGGKALVGESYREAKEKMAEQKAQRAEKKEAKKEAEGGGEGGGEDWHRAGRGEP